VESWYKIPIRFGCGPIKNDAIGKGMQSYTVLCEMLTEATFNQTNFWFFWFFSPHFCDTILVLKFNMFIYARVDHSKFAIMYEDSSEFYQHLLKWHIANIQKETNQHYKVTLNFTLDQRESEINLSNATFPPEFPCSVWPDLSTKSKTGFPMSYVPCNVD
jgi:hypothetical protein